MSPVKRCQLSKDVWLSEMMDRPVFQLMLTEKGNVSKKDIQKLIIESPGFVYSKIPSTQVPLLNEIEAAGFRCVDVNLDFSLSGRSRVEKPTRGLLIREAIPQDHSAVIRLARKVFRFSRFHLDPQIPVPLANKIKREWVRNSLTGKRGDSVFVGEKAGKIVSFLTTVLHKKRGNQNILRIDLMGVDPHFQGRDIGSEMVKFFIAHSRNKAKHVAVGTQASNIPSVRLYEKCGFRLASTSYVCHFHSLRRKKR